MLFQSNLDRYYLDGLIKIPKEEIALLKGMNSNIITGSKEYDYRFISRLLLAVFEEKDLCEGCVKQRDTKTPCIYKELDEMKFSFVKGLFFTKFK